MELESNLRELGLKETEAKVYLTLLNIGPSTAISIAKRISIHRRTVYDTLNILINRGYVSTFCENGIKNFKANNPKIFLALITEKKRILEATLPFLSQIFEQEKETTDISVINGIDGLKPILVEMIESKKEILWMGGGFKLNSLLLHSNRRMLDSLAKTNIRTIQAKSKESALLSKTISKIKIIPEKFQTNIAFFTYDNIVLLSQISQKGVISIKIENKEFANTFKNYFELIWM